jgi:hypothetical protein
MKQSLFKTLYLVRLFFNLFLILWWVTWMFNAASTRGTALRPSLSLFAIKTVFWN